jgi:hypothetical protein
MAGSSGFGVARSCARRARVLQTTTSSRRNPAMSSAQAARRAAVPVSNACAPLQTDLGGRSESQARASRKNGARSKGPKTAQGKARAAQNAMKHGLRAGKYVLLRDEDPFEFDDLEVALFKELAPVGVLQCLLVGRLARAAWRLARAERLEVEMFREHHFPGGGAGLAMIRDANSSKAFATLVRYRGAAMAEFARCLKTLKELQAEAAATAAGEAKAPALEARPRRPAPVRRAAAARRPQPDEPRAPTATADAASLPAARPAVAASKRTPAAAGSTTRAETPLARPASAERRRPNEPEGRAAAPASPMPVGVAPGRARHAPAAPWPPNAPETAPGRRAAPAQP